MSILPLCFKSEGNRTPAFDFGDQFTNLAIRHSFYKTLFINYFNCSYRARARTYCFVRLD